LGSCISFKFERGEREIEPLRKIRCKFNDHQTCSSV
jgi:hypothetical protein